MFQFFAPPSALCAEIDATVEHATGEQAPGKQTTGEQAPGEHATSEQANAAVAPENSRRSR